ncbi:unnamed protein product [Mesocestoides corti]|uniref:Fibronectin type-III domain-containing protein n=1 Tax=Mesocestoides corti TaxID=53468 RepID=A0A0R3URA8_MESCO|nr:unnamed protein product [Mesocestoides corti]
MSLYISALQRLITKEVVVVDAHTLLVSWYDPKNVEGTLGGFTVSVGRYGRESPNKPEWRHVANVTTDSRSYRITDLEPNTRYEVTVRGYVLPNEEGHGGGYSQYSYFRSASTWSAGSACRHRYRNDLGSIETRLATRRATTTTATTTRPVIEPSLYLDWTDASGFHLRWDFQDVMHGSIQKIELIAVPVDSDLGVANASAVVAPNVTEGSITTGLRPYTEYDVVVEFTTNGATTAYTAGRAWTWSSALLQLLVKDIVVVDAHTLEVSWYKPENVEGTLGGFTISTRPYVQGFVNKPEWRHVANVTADSRSYRITDLEPNTRYEVTVRGYVLPNEEGQGGGYNQYSYPRIASTLSTCR